MSEIYFSVFDEDPSHRPLSTWWKDLAPCQGLKDCRVTLYQGGALQVRQFGNLKLFCVSKLIGGSRTRDLSDKLSIYLDI